MRGQLTDIHARVRQALLEDLDQPWVQEHRAACRICSLFATVLETIDRARWMEVPSVPQSLLAKVIPAGVSAADIADVLFEQGFLPEAIAWRNRAVAEGSDETFREDRGPAPSDDSSRRGPAEGEGEHTPWPVLTPEQQQRLESLYDQRDRLIAFAAHSLPADELDSAEDLVQTVFLESTRRCSASPHFLPGERWLLRRLRSRIIERYRHRDRERRHGVWRGPLPDAWAVQVTSADRVVSAEEEAIANVRVEELLATIPDPKDRAAIRLKIEGLQEADIARLLGVHYTTRQVRDRLVRARRQVKEAVRRDGGPDRRVGGPAA